MLENNCVTFGVKDKVCCMWFATGLEYSPDTPVSSTNKTDITEILLKVALSTIKTNIYEGHMKVVMISSTLFVHGNTSLYQISKAKGDSMDIKMTPKFIYLTLISKAYEGRDDT